MLGLPKGVKVGSENNMLASTMISYCLTVAMPMRSNLSQHTFGHVPMKACLTARLFAEQAMVIE